MNGKKFKEMVKGKVKPLGVERISIKIGNNEVEFTKKKKKIKDVYVNGKRYSRNPSFWDLDDSRKIAIASLYGIDALGAGISGYYGYKLGNKAKKELQKYDEIFSIFQKDFHDLFKSSEISTMKNVEYFIKHENFSKKEGEIIKNFILNYHDYNKMEINKDKIIGWIDKGYEKLSEIIAEPIQKKVDVEKNPFYKIFSFGDKNLRKIKNKEDSQLTQEQHKKIVNQTYEMFNNTDKLENKIEKDLRDYVSTKNPTQKEQIIYEMNLFNQQYGLLKGYLGKELKELKTNQDSLDVILRRNMELTEEIKEKVDKLMAHQSKLDYIPFATFFGGVVLGYVLFKKMTGWIERKIKSGDYAKFE